MSDICDRVDGCAACGNRTAAGVSREAVAGEWNETGWCGQGPAAPEYVPFGEEWRAQMMRMRKPDLVRMLADACRRGLALDGLVARLRVRRNRRELAAVVDRLVQRGIIEMADAAGAKRNLAKGGAS